MLWAHLLRRGPPIVFVPFPLGLACWAALYLHVLCFLYSRGLGCVSCIYLDENCSMGLRLSSRLLARGCPGQYLISVHFLVGSIYLASPAGTARCWAGRLYMGSALAYYRQLSFNAPCVPPGCDMLCFIVPWCAFCLWDRLW